MMSKNRDETERWKRVVGLVSLVLLSAGCSARQAESTPTDEETMAKLQACAPQTDADGDIQLTIRSVSLEAQATKVTVSAAAPGGPAVFDWPVYRLSSGRWLIGGRGRAYLLDEACREYKLKDRKSVPGFEIPLEGRVELKPDRPFEAVLVFPRVAERARVGLLVYDGRSLPLRFGADGR
jgi:hypothetical protein